ncbi:MAG: twin-arginine translocation signal domain-containing protein [Thermoleophilia bacterium]|nr:twin-arginine translocation signal domain-containing protein [Thermoleophilia bacterium]
MRRREFISGGIALAAAAGLAACPSHLQHQPSTACLCTTFLRRRRISVPTG